METCIRVAFDFPFTVARLPQYGGIVVWNIAPILENCIIVGFDHWDKVALKLRHYISTCWGNPGTGMFLGNQHCRNIPVRILEMLDFFSKNPTLDLNFTATLGTNIAALFPQEINVAWV